MKDQTSPTQKRGGGIFGRGFVGPHPTRPVTQSSDVFDNPDILSVVSPTEDMYVSSDLSWFIEEKPHVLPQEITWNGKRFRRLDPKFMLWICQLTDHVSSAWCEGKMPDSDYNEFCLRTEAIYDWFVEHWLMEEETRRLFWDLCSKPMDRSYAPPGNGATHNKPKIDDRSRPGPRNFRRNKR